MKKRRCFFFLILLLAVLAGCARITFFSRTQSDTVRLDYPEEWGRLYGTVKIAGIAQAKSEFNSYVLEVWKQPKGPWQTLAQGNTPVPEPSVDLERDILGVWETEGFKGGEYKIRLTVYADGKSQSVAKEHIFLENCTHITGISVDPVKFNPYAGETTSIAYTLAAQSEVKIKFYNAYKETVDSYVPGVQSIGPHTFVWKGKGPGPQAVDDTAYTFSIEAQKISDQSIQIYYPSDGLVKVTPTQVSLSPSFKPQRNEKCEINYTIDKPSWVRIGMGSPDEMTCDLHWYGIGGYSPQLSGSHTEYWNGRSEKLWDVSILFWQPKIRGVLWAHTLPDNFIITEGKNPEITNLQANPVIIDPDKGMGTDLSYTLSRDMTISIKIYDGTYPELRFIRTLFVKQPRSAGPHIEHWDGLSAQGDPVAPPSPYTFYIEGVDQDNLGATPQCGAVVIKGH
ncbi:MAG: FlgD immunoglobulin-like domain containing protein [bacterium]